MNSDKDFMFASIIILFMIFGCLQVILSAVEGLNGFKKLNIKDIAREQEFYL